VASLAATITELQHRYGAAAEFKVRKSIEFVQQATADPIEARRRIESLLGFVGPEAAQMRVTFGALRISSLLSTFASTKRICSARES